jgi:hypothetical protein
MVKVKQYIVLAGDTYYPAAWNDYRGSYDTLKKADNAGKKLLKSGIGVDWYEVVNLATMQVEHVY